MVGRLSAHYSAVADQIVRGRFRKTEVRVARQLELNGRQYLVLSEPHPVGWRAWVTEVRADGNVEVGIEATGETRSAADDSAERKLRRLLQAQ